MSRSGGTAANAIGRRTGLVGAAAGVLAAGVGAGLAVERFLVGRRRTPDPALDEPFGSRRGKPHIVETTDGLELYAEVDEPPGAASAGLINVVFCHGYALNLDCFHFQRRALAGQTRMIFYDQRSHGRSGRSPADKCTVDQLGDDLARVIEDLVPEGPIVLIGHSMGGMSIMAYAAHHQGGFSDRVSGVALLATSAGNLNNVTLGAPGLAGKLVGRVVPTFVGAMSRMPDLINQGRKAGSDIEFLLTKRYSFASKVPPARVEFVAEMLAATPIEVVAEFFPAFGVHDKYEALEQLADVDVVIMCGEDDLITPVEHSRQIAARLPSADFLALSDSGHMLMIEYPEVINERLRELVERAAGAAAWEEASR